MASLNTDPSVSAESDAVSFESEGERVVGRLLPKAFGDGPAPGIVILGPMCFQKEQAPTLYAQRFAELGYATLIFDPRYRGESGGEPRCLEDPMAKVADARAGLAYLAAHPGVDPDRLAMVGICMGAAHALRVAADEPLVRTVATVTGQYRDGAADVAWLGGQEAVAQRRARGEAASQKYQATGEIEYVPAVDYSRIDVGMPGELPWSWYQLWSDRGLWENRYAVMSDVGLLSFESLSAAARLTKPLVMIHSDLCALPDCARRHFAVVPTADKQLVWEGSTRHLQYYDDPAVIDRTVLSIVDWFGQHLGPAGLGSARLDGNQAGQTMTLAT
jgi:dienelactone hydrolase